MTAPGVIWESQLMIIVAWRCHMPAASEFGKTGTPDSSLCGGRGIRGWFYGI